MISRAAVSDEHQTLWRKHIQHAPGLADIQDPNLKNWALQISRMRLNKLGLAHIQDPILEKLSLADIQDPIPKTGPCRYPGLDLNQEDETRRGGFQIQTSIEDAEIAALKRSAAESPRGGFQSQATMR